MTSITPFAFNDALVRVVRHDKGEPWFVAADVCAVLGVNNSRQALTRLDDDEKGVISTDTLGGQQDMNIINESGLYSLVLGSRKPEAKRFKKWVTAEVLPAIRKTGVYSSAGARADAALFRGHGHILRLLDKLKRADTATEQSIIHGMLGSAMQVMGMTPAEMEDLLPAKPAQHQLLEPFWRQVAELEAAGERVNHSRNPDLIAINMNHYQQACAKCQLPKVDRNDLMRALKTSPRFVGLRTVNSAIIDGTAKCWMFKAQE